jgi:predicted 3-demethylubiquinone-9 3-methyltransferase (glyoxalase superfamily)
MLHTMAVSADRIGSRRRRDEPMINVLSTGQYGHEGTRPPPHPIGDPTMQKITPCLWFDTEGEEAAKLYTSVFEDSKITNVTHYGDAGPRPAGTVMTVDFELAGQKFVALNGGPDFKFTEALSFQVSCETQEEVDRFWDSLSDGGEEGPCGWLKDRFGLSWQIIPTALSELLNDPDQERSQRAMQAMLQMGKIDIDALRRAADPQG